MEKAKHSYSMSLTADRTRATAGIIILPVLIVALGLSKYHQMLDKGWSDHAIRNYLIFFALLFAAAYLAALYEFLAKLHFVPEGIAITLFGFTVHRFPAEQIKLLGGVFYGSSSKYGTQYRYRIAVCDRTLEELADVGEQKTPKMLRNSRSLKGWAEDMAGKYLHRYARSYLRCLNRSCRILWLEWDKERLEALQQMYPAARWIDFTEKKIFDEQLRQR